MKTELSSACAVAPLWAKLYWNYSQRMPEHRGKGKILRTLHRIGVRKDIPFIWKMKNGTSVAISPTEGFARWSVGWTCFEKREWEPHIEAFLARCIKPGARLFDIGSNLGYFAAVMARSAGPTGKVWAFEPVPATFRQLQLCKDFNGFRQMTVFACALGCEEGTVAMHYIPSILGAASIHAHAQSADSRTVMVPIHRLDDLWKAGQVELPDLIKIDVEGHEYETLRGGRELLTAARPDIIFEWNAHAATSAGWDLRKLAALLCETGDYRFARIVDGRLQPVDVAEFRIGGGDYVDLFATTRAFPET